MSYTIKTITQYAVINDDNGLPIATCKTRQEAEAITWMMAAHGAEAGKPYAFNEWARDNSRAF